MEFGQVQDLLDSSLDGLELGQDLHALLAGQLGPHQVDLELGELHRHEPGFLQQQALLPGRQHRVVELVLELRHPTYQHLDIPLGGTPVAAAGDQVLELLAGRDDVIDGDILAGVEAPAEGVVSDAFGQLRPALVVLLPELEVQVEFGVEILHLLLLDFLSQPLVLLQQSHSSLLQLLYLLCSLGLSLPQRCNLLLILNNFLTLRP